MCSNMDGPRECRTEWSRGDISYDIPYTWNLKRNDTNKLIKQKETHRLRKWTHSGCGEEIVKDFGKVLYTLLYLKWITTKTYWIAQGSLLNVMCQPGWKGCGGEWMRGYVWMCMAESLHCSPETVTALLTSCNAIQTDFGVKKKKKRIRYISNNKKFRLNTFPNLLLKIVHSWEVPVCMWGGCVCLRTRVLTHVWLCDPLDYSPPGSSVRGLFQARILEWAAISFSGDLPTQGSPHLLCLLQWQGTVYHCATWAGSQV